MNQTKGAIRYLRSMSPLKITVNGELVEIDITNHRLRALIVAKELFNDEYSIYSSPLLELSRQTGVPCIALDYGELDMYTRISSKSKFFEAFYIVYYNGLQNRKISKVTHLADG